jgi:soluble lytic murein transglycosylase-like protein
MESVRRQKEAAGTIRRADPAEAQPPAPVCDPVGASDLSEMAADAAKKEGLTPDLLRAIIGRESSFRPCAVSPKGAMGLMQLMPETARDLGVADPFNPQQNIAAGSKFLRRLLDRYGQDLSLALGAYNAGPKQVDRYQGLPPFVETIDYVRDIMAKLP